METAGVPRLLTAPPILFNREKLAMLGLADESVANALCSENSERRLAFVLARNKAMDVAAVIGYDAKANQLKVENFSNRPFSHTRVRVAGAFYVSLESLVGKATGTHTVYRNFPYVSFDFSEEVQLAWRDPQTDLSRDGVKSYVGVTGRGWMARFGEHLACAKGGSALLFHQALRQSFASSKEADGFGLAAVHILALGVSEEEAYALEAKHISELSLYPMGYNMVPGGAAGARVIDKFLKGKTTNQNREERLLELVASRENPFKHLTDQEYSALMTRIVCNNPNNFSVDEVREIRLLGEIGWSNESIAQRLGVLEYRIAHLLEGKRYKMVA